MRFFLLALVVGFSAASGISYGTTEKDQSDPKSYARELTNILAGPDMKGRGYYLEGDHKAAAYLQPEFARIGLKPVADRTTQEFELGVNTFPSEPVLTLGDQTLRLGVDFIPSPSAPTSEGSGFLYFLDEKVFTDPAALAAFSSADLSDKVVVYDQRFDAKTFVQPDSFTRKIKEAAAVVVTAPSLIFSVGRSVAVRPKFTVLASLLDATRGALPVQFKIESKFIDAYRTANILGMVPGTSTPDQYLVFSAHYDHLGAIGDKIYFPGANDNATGVAMMLSLAKYFVANPQKYSVIFVAFAGEEAGLVGSKYFVDHPLVPLAQIRFLVNLDLFGTGEDGMTAVNGTVFPEAFTLLTQVNSEKSYLTRIAARGKAANSDHFYFSEAGVPAFFFYLEGKSWTAYHSITDTTAVPLSRFDEAYHLILDFGTRVMAMELPVLQSFRGRTRRAEGASAPILED